MLRGRGSPAVHPATSGPPPPPLTKGPAPIVKSIGAISVPSPKLSVEEMERERVRERERGGADEKREKETEKETEKDTTMTAMAATATTTTTATSTTTTKTTESQPLHGGRVLEKSVSDAAASASNALTSPRGLAPLDRAVSVDSVTAASAVKEAQQRWNITPSKRGPRTASDVATPVALPPVRPLTQTAPDSSAIAAAAAQATGPDLQAVNMELDRLRNMLVQLQSRVRAGEKERRLSQAPADTSPAAASSGKEMPQSTILPLLTEGVSTDPSMLLNVMENDKAIFHAGWMSKKGRKVRNWKTRWFSLRGNKLLYYAKESDKTPLGEINLETCVVEELKEREESGRPCMALLVEGRKLFFYCDSGLENRKWYLYLVCKNAELTYLRKMKLTGQEADNALVRFFETPMVEALNMNRTKLSIDSVVALSAPLRVHDSLVSMSLQYASLDDLAVSSLCNAIKMSVSMEEIDLEGNSITAEGAESLAAVLASNPMIKKLNLRENQLGDAGVAALATVLADGGHPRLTKLDLDGNNITAAGAVALAKSIPHLNEFPVISLTDNRIGDKGVAALLEACGTNRTVETIRVDKNDIRDQGALSLASCLSQNSNLTKVCFGGNPISKAALKRVVQSLLRNNSVQYIEIGRYLLKSTDLASLRLLYNCDLIADLVE